MMALLAAFLSSPIHRLKKTFEVDFFIKIILDFGQLITTEFLSSYFLPFSYPLLPFPSYFRLFPKGTKLIWNGSKSSWHSPRITQCTANTSRKSNPRVFLTWAFTLQVPPTPSSLSLFPFLSALPFSALLLTDEGIAR